MGLVRGEDVVLSTSQSNGVTNVIVPFGCARSVTFDISTDFIETSVTESGAFKTFIPSGKQYSGNIEGLVFINRPATNVDTEATAVLDFSDLADSGFFPSFNANASVFSDFPTFEAVTLSIVSGATDLDLSQFLIDINGILNVYGATTGYTSVISGNTIIITAPIGTGASINTFTVHCNYDIDGNTGTITGTFSGGTDGYYPDKLGIGWMYDKIMSGEQIYLLYYETDDDNNYLQKQCNVFIESINETSSFDNIVTFSASFKGTGAPIIDYGEI
jgi:hypothetical protein